MGKLQFQMGASQHVRIVLPSKQHGNRDLFIGKAMVRVPGLNTTQEVAITRSSLRHFFDQLDKANKTLKGAFQLESTDSRFKLKGSVNRKGAYQFEVVCTGFHFTQPENTEWSASISFACGWMDYQEAVSMLKMEEAEQAD
ncbi:MAG: hypothetical protein EOP84_07540 [Verrucomicrobiaceae bacterium]|nr:MAG: hypothetical protein EOP84_07540 [Verrucomicrobiaceae bacterium]